MKYYLNWRYWVRRLTVKDAAIAVLVMIVGVQWAFISQTEHIVNKLNEENERPQVENERFSHLLDFSLSNIQRGKPRKDICDQFRSEHPTREELRGE